MLKIKKLPGSLMCVGFGNGKGEQYTNYVVGDKVSDDHMEKLKLQFGDDIEFEEDKKPGPGRPPKASPSAP